MLTLVADAKRRVESLALQVRQTRMTGPRRSPRYDPKTEVTVNGTIEEVKEYPSRSGKRTGQHVMLKTDSGNLSVQLGPSDYWKENGFELAKSRGRRSP
jgi:hypothetical protein